MSSIHRTLLIAAPADAVWQIVSEVGCGKDWMPDITARQISTPPPASVGTSWREEGLLRGKPYSTVYTITRWEPPLRLSYKRAPGGRGDYEWTESVELEPAGEQTRVTLRLDYDMPGGIVGKVYERILFRKDFSGTLDNRLERLKEVLEKPAQGVKA
jgi:uncharacterized membrane protein